MHSVKAEVASCPRSPGLANRSLSHATPSSIIDCLGGKFFRPMKLGPWPKASASCSRSMPRRSLACDSPSRLSRRRRASSGSSSRPPVTLLRPPRSYKPQAKEPAPDIMLLRPRSDPTPWGEGAARRCCDGATGKDQIRNTEPSPHRHKARRGRCWLDMNSASRATIRQEREKCPRIG